MSFKSLLSTCGIFSVYLFESVDSSGATAKFDANNNGIEGEVNVTDGRIVIALDISVLMAMDYSGIPDGETCFTDGLKYHIHEKWTWPNDTDRIAGQCSGTQTGGHWDPWLACGSATGNDYCVDEEGCVSGSSALQDSTGYDCDSTNFDINAYSCEVGDWNGKYGLAMVENGTIYVEGESAFEVDGSDVLDTYAVVFHCNGGDRAFCSPFNTAFDDDTARPTQEDEGDFDADFKMAIFTGNNISAGLALYPNGSTIFAIDFDETNLDLDNECSELMVRIYNDWDDDLGYSSTSSCDDAVGMFYDPTVTCAYGSDSEFCTGTYLCNDTSYSYSCDYDNDRFGCAPGDITGKYGTITVADSGVVTINEVDDLLIDLQLLEGKSVVLQCSNDYSIVACAGLYDNDYTTGDDMTTTVATSENMNTTDSDPVEEDGANMLNSLNSSIIFTIMLCLFNHIF